MKKILTLGITAVLLCAGLMVSVAAAAPKGIDMNGPHYNLNIIGKKVDWNGGGNYDNPDRHTIFVPEDTSAYSFNVPIGVDVNGNYIYSTLSGVRIWMTQSTDPESDFAVFDGNAFGDGEARFQLAPGKYKVYIVAKAKPSKTGEYTTDITGWYLYEDTTDTNTYYYYQEVGSVSVTRKWKEATDLFYIDTDNGEQWVFDYIATLPEEHQENGYFWQYDNHGNKLVKVRFYPV